MSRWTVPPGCDSIKMKSTGEVFVPNRQGSIDVPDRYDGELKRSAQHLRGYAEPGRHAVVHNGAGKVCVKCAFHAFNFSKVCPKCGSDEFKVEEN